MLACLEPALVVAVELRHEQDVRGERLGAHDCELFDRLAALDEEHAGRC
jgi:hypothetical protein